MSALAFFSGAAVVLFIVAVIGLIGVQKTGNYENKWGYMLFYGGGGHGVCLIFVFAFLLIEILLTVLARGTP